jgi:hypothetical protein
MGCGFCGLRSNFPTGFAGHSRGPHLPHFAASNYGPYSNTSTSLANLPEAFSIEKLIWEHLGQTMFLVMELKHLNHT